LETKPQDLRIIKTRWAIREAFAAMICEMGYEQVTIKELTARARINRKTFYLHYPSLDALLGELQDYFVDDFMKRTSSLKGLHDIAAFTREFFLYTTDHEWLKERILCGGSYRFIADKIVEKILRGNENYRVGAGFDTYTENIVTTFLASSIIEMYRQWVADGKKITIEEMIKIASRLVCHGLSSLGE
jgi:AcrR family transcriptional regulator